LEPQRTGPEAPLPRTDALPKAALVLAVPLAVATGGAHALSFAPFDMPAVQIAALAVLITLVQLQPSWRHAAAMGFAFGLGWFGTGVNWVYISLHDFGGLAAWLATLATAALTAVLAAFPALAAGAAYRASNRPVLRLLLAWPGAWALSEWLRGTVLTGFPWIASGYAHTNGPLAGYAPLAGVYGLCLICAVVAGAFAAALAQPRSTMSPTTRAGALAVAVLLLVGGQMLVGRQWTHPIGAPLQVKLIQGDIAQDLKFGEGGTDLALERYFTLMPDPASLHSDLVVLPESAFPLPLDDLPPDARERLLDFPRRHDTALIFGVFLEHPAGDFYNSAVGLQDSEALQQYSKRHLVPFGEFIPFGFRWFVDLMRIPIGDQHRGADYQAPMQLAGQRIAVNICFEDLFGAEIIRAWQDPARAPTMLLNLSNLAWFGNSIALPQHLQISRMRALETGRPVLRATNTGATAIVDPQGRVQGVLPYNLIATLRGEVRGYEGRTPYVIAGNAPALALAIALYACALAARRNRLTASLAGR